MLRLVDFGSVSLALCEETGDVYPYCRLFFLGSQEVEEQADSDGESDGDFVGEQASAKRFELGAWGVERQERAHHDMRLIYDNDAI